MASRLDPHLFHIPLAEIKAGWYSDKYFSRTKQVLEKDYRHPHVLMQVWSQKAGNVCGTDEAIAVLKLCSDPPGKIKIRALCDGDSINADETVMTIEGDYAAFVGARQGFPRTPTPPGEKCKAWAPWADLAYGGDTVKACLAFVKHMPADIPIMALVDFENDCVRTSVECAKALGKRLWGIRLDTSLKLRDKSVTSTDASSQGVCPELVQKVRQALDNASASHVKIIVSGGFNERRIREFRRLGVPFDAVGIGSALLQDRMDFTADIVQVGGKHCAKVGRKFNPHPKLQDVP